MEGKLVTLHFLGVKNSSREIRLAGSFDSSKDKKISALVSFGSSLHSFPAGVVFRSKRKSRRVVNNCSFSISSMSWCSDDFRLAVMELLVYLQFTKQRISKSLTVKKVFNKFFLPAFGSFKTSFANPRLPKYLCPSSNS